MWDTATQRRLVAEPLLVPVTGSVVESIAFSPNGKTLAAGYHGLMSGYKNGVVLFDVDPCSWARRAGQIANRNFTWDEWREYFPDQPSYRRTFRELPWPSDLPVTERKKTERKEIVEELSTL